MSRPYERLQLELIAREYERRGYSVTLEQPLGSNGFRFDAVARSKKDDSIVIIELTNAARSAAQWEQRISAVEQFAKDFPTASVDLRYIDPEIARWASLLSERQRVSPIEASPQLFGAAQLIDPQLAPSRLLWLWSWHAANLRAFSNQIQAPSGDSKNILAPYNDLLASGRLRAPEDLDDNVDLDLFKLFDIVMVAVHGGTVTENEVDQMWAHLVSTYRQIEAFQPQSRE